MIVVTKSKQRLRLGDETHTVNVTMVEPDYHLIDRCNDFRRVMRGVNPTTLAIAVNRIVPGINFKGTPKHRLLTYFSSKQNTYPKMLLIAPQQLQESIEWVKKTYGRSK